MPNSSLRIVVLGYIVRGPLGGLVWHHLQYLLGLHDLGHEVYYVEDSDDYPSCYDPSRHITSVDAAYGLAFADRVFRHFSMADRWAYFDAHRDRWTGPLSESVLSIIASADVVLNLSGVNPIRPWLQEVPTRVFVDTDPAFTQIRHLQDPVAKQRAAQHSHFVSFGANIPQGRSRIPDDGFAWQATRQPICLDAWPVLSPPSEGCFTTVMQWDSYASREHAGISYGMKSASFAPYESLPRQVSAQLELAVGSPQAPRAQLENNGWRLRDPLEVTHDPWSYQRYLQASKAEFSVAKHGYVVSESGWFSERSAAYLASGRPVVVQSTGFETWLQADRAVLSFNSAETARAAIQEVVGNYAQHQQAARDVCAEYFDARRVLSALLEGVMSNAVPHPTASASQTSSSSEQAREF